MGVPHLVWAQVSRALRAGALFADDGADVRVTPGHGHPSIAAPDPAVSPRGLLRSGAAAPKINTGGMKAIDGGHHGAKAGLVARKQGPPWLICWQR